MDKHQQANVQLDIDFLSSLIAERGKLSQLKENFELRNEQLEMLELVAECFNNNTILTVEAGTGVGKSLAYLIPAFAWILQTDDCVVISSATNNLQHQLLENDIPLVRKLFQDSSAHNLKVAIAKGRGHYLCLRRLNEHIEENALFRDEELLAIRTWAESSESGDRSDYHRKVSSELWSRINSDKDHCHDKGCRQAGNCFFQRARQKMSEAQLIITNHHLLFTDLAIRSEGLGPDMPVILPSFQRVIIDEAHNLETVTTDCYSTEFTQNTVHTYLSRLHQVQNKKAMGLIPYLQKLYNYKFPDIEEKIKVIRSILKDIEQKLLPYFSNSIIVLNLSLNENGESNTSNYLDFDDNLCTHLTLLKNELRKCTKILKSELDSFEPIHLDDAKSTELILIISGLEKIITICDKFVHDRDMENEVFWIDKQSINSGNHTLCFHIAPMNIANNLSIGLFDVFPSIIMTSATLAVDNRLDNWHKRMGLEQNKRVQSKILGSPFDFTNNVLLAIPTDPPEPTLHESYFRWLQQFLPKVLEISDGRALVLFTAFHMLNSVCETCRPILQGLGINSLVQGEEPRTQLLKNFQSEKASVLFATYSFWEGVDIPGDSLKLVVICRLPFRVPDHPILYARNEYLQRQNRNPFIELSLADAIIKLKQGFGRLMRTKTDSGVVIITDRRIIRKPYGKSFINSLPPAQLVVDHSEALLDIVESALYSKRTIPK